MMTTLPLPSNYCSVRCLANNRHSTNTCELYKGDSHNTVRSTYFFSCIFSLSQSNSSHKYSLGTLKILSTDEFSQNWRNRQSHENKFILPPQKSTTFLATCTKYLALSCNNWCGLHSLLKHTYTSIFVPALTYTDFSLLQPHNQLFPVSENIPSGIPVYPTMVCLSWPMPPSAAALFLSSLHI